MLNISLIINILLFITLISVILLKKQNSSSDKIDSIERELKELSTIFNQPYLRGEAGETLLKELLKNYLPPDAYKFQYGFSSGVRVDAIVKTGKYIIPIDSKFPIESVKDLLLTSDKISNQIIKRFLKHGEDIAKKYIQPAEGTLNFAIMYIPSEKLYYKAFVSEQSDLNSKLLKMGILPASPSTLFAMIQTVVYGLKGFSLNNKHGEVITKIEALRVNYTQLDKQFSITKSHMKNLKQSMELCEKLLDESIELIPK